MPHEPQDEVRRLLQALQGELEDLRRRIENLEQRVAARETGAAPPPPPWPAPPVQPAAVPAPESLPAAVQAAPAEATAEAPGEQLNAAPLETSLGLVWLNRAGVLTLLLGVAFLFRHAVDNDWIGPRMRVALGALAGLAALGSGEWLWRRGQRIFSMGILALGLGLLYVSFYAAHGFYGFAPASAAFAAMALATASGAWLALRHEAQPVMVLSLAGGFATPLVLDTGRDAPWVLFPYLLLLDAGAAWTGVRRGWRAAPVAAAGASVWVFSWWLASRFEPAARAPAVFFVLGVYAAFLCVPLPLLRGILQVFAGVSLAAIWQQEEGRLPGFLLPLAAAGLWRVSPLFVWAGFWMPWWLGPTGSGASLAVRLGGAAAGFVLLSGWLVWRCREDRPQTLARDLAVLSANALAFAATGYFELRPSHGDWAGLLLFALAAAHAGAAWLLRRRDEAAQLCALLAAVFLTLAIPAQFGGWRLGIAWATEAALLGWLARRFGSERLEWVALTVLLTALVRVAAVDARAARPLLLLNAPFLTMLWTALSSWASAALYMGRAASAAAWLAGHLMLLAGLELEALAEVRRSVAAESVRSAEIVVFSMVLAAYGVALVALGMARRAAADRAAGLAALVLTLVKLYAYDVWQLGRLFRTTAFLGLGVLLVAASWLYSRHRERVARLLRPDR